MNLVSDVGRVFFGVVLDVGCSLSYRLCVGYGMRRGDVFIVVDGVVVLVISFSYHLIVNLVYVS
jgi:hypothetical protein